MMIEHNHYSLSELASRLSDNNLTEERLFRYGREGKLKISYLLKTFGEIDRIHLSKCKKVDDKEVVIEATVVQAGDEIAITLTPRFIGMFVDAISGNVPRFGINIFDLPVIIKSVEDRTYFTLLTEPTFDKNTGIEIYFKAKDFVVELEEVKKFEEEFREVPLPSYIDPAHPHYSKHIDVLISVWKDIFENHLYLDQRNCKQAAIKCIEENYEKDFRVTPTDKTTMAQFINACLPSDRRSEFPQIHNSKIALE
jgi:hypothetical protein